MHFVFRYLRQALIPLSHPLPSLALQRRAYKLKTWTDAEDFLTQLAKLSGKLLKGGDPDLNITARMVLLDWQKGKIPFFTLPPGHTEEKPPPMAAVAAAGAVAGAVAGVAVPPAEALDVAEEELPAPAEAVTEEDAVKEAGARPEDAAAGEGATDEVAS